MKTGCMRWIKPAGLALACSMAERAGDVVVELTPSDAFLVKNTAEVTQLVVNADGRIGMGVQPSLHRLSVKSSTSTADGSAVFIHNSNEQGIALVTETTSTDVNAILGQHGAGDFLYCDSWDGLLNWQRVLALRKDGAVESRGLKLTDAASTGSQYGIVQYSSGSPSGLGFLVDLVDPPALIIRETQNVGIGTTDPGSHRLSVASGEAGTAGSTVAIENAGSLGIALISTVWSADVNTILSQRGSGDFLYCDAWDGSTNWRRVIRMLKDGTVECKVLSITGGADLAEPFDVSETGGTSPEPGRVMVIDQEHEGLLKVSNRAYDRCVAGVVSGAGGVSPGVLLRQEGTEATGKHPVALTGRVYGWADATAEPIRPGDLLTTSATPGHAMKVTDAERAQGAILGKAMSALPEGRGLVLILVTLQ